MKLILIALLAFAGSLTPITANADPPSADQIIGDIEERAQKDALHFIDVNGIDQVSSPFKYGQIRGADGVVMEGQLDPVPHPYPKDPYKQEIYSLIFWNTLSDTLWAARFPHMDH